ncbi:hypothetical protein KFL_000970130 [Klebsormidium nitens]|uniref:Uncharacterized protein n=1 Tax=Klebsormidium nitens TaxID=105231 RepID=A0A0U9HRU4_KLENI|nr:hypothetical protein KFL_000970130 [Klebsormidium nitens]|eukprot:GAQ81988.1 hypothetical protein KFL_000970130 [Klebsormidium nitens]
MSTREGPLSCQIRAETSFSHFSAARTTFAEVNPERPGGEALRAGRHLRPAAQGNNEGIPEPDMAGSESDWSLFGDLSDQWVSAEEEGSPDRSSPAQEKLQRIEEAGFRVWLHELQLWSREEKCSISELLMRFYNEFQISGRMGPGKAPKEAAHLVNLEGERRTQAILVGLLYSMSRAPATSHQLRPHTLPPRHGLVRNHRDAVTVIAERDPRDGYGGVVLLLGCTARLDRDYESVDTIKLEQDRKAQVFGEQPGRRSVVSIIGDEQRIEFWQTTKSPDEYSDRLLYGVPLDLDYFEEDNWALRLLWKVLCSSPKDWGCVDWPKQMEVDDSIITITAHVGWGSLGYCVFKGKKAAPKVSPQSVPGGSETGEASGTEEEVYVAFYESKPLRKMAFTPDAPCRLAFIASSCPSGEKKHRNLVERQVFRGSFSGEIALRAGRLFRAAAQGKNEGIEEPDLARSVPGWSLAVELSKWLEEAGLPYYDPRAQTELERSLEAGFRVWLNEIEHFLREEDCSLEELLMRYADHAYRAAAKIKRGKAPEKAPYVTDLEGEKRTQAILFGLLYSMYWAPPKTQLIPRSRLVWRGNLQYQRDAATVINTGESGSGYEGVVSPLVFIARLDREGYSVALAQARESMGRVLDEQPERNFAVSVIADEHRVDIWRMERSLHGNSNQLLFSLPLDLDKFEEDNLALRLLWEVLYLPTYVLGYVEWPRCMELRDSVTTITDSDHLAWSKVSGYCIFKGKQVGREAPGGSKTGEGSGKDQEVFVAFYASESLRNEAIDNLVHWPGGELRSSLKASEAWPSAPFPNYLVVGGAAIRSRAIFLALTKLQRIPDKE